MSVDSKEFNEQVIAIPPNKIELSEAFDDDKSFDVRNQQNPEKL